MSENSQAVWVLAREKQGISEIIKKDITGAGRGKWSLKAAIASIS
jgi:hypothetical protein